MTGKKSINYGISTRFDPPAPAFLRVAMLTLTGITIAILELAIGLSASGCGIGTPRIGSIAVLSFENLSHDPTQDYLAEGVTSELTDYLGRIGVFRVISRSSVLRYRGSPKPLPDVARELNVDAVVQGSVQRSGDRIRLITNLTHVPANRRLWEQTYERDQSDIPAVLGDISRAIADEIKVKLTPQQKARLNAPRPVNPQALQACWRGIFGRDRAKAEADIKQAMQLDPKYALPYLMLAIHSSSALLPPKDTYPKVKETAQKAVSLDPALSYAHVMLANVALEYDWDFKGAEKEFKRAVEINPNSDSAHHAYAHFLLSMGRMEEANAESKRAMEIDPMNGDLLACVAWHDIAKSNYDEAEKHCLQATSLGFRSSGPMVHLMLGWSYEQRSRFDEAIQELQKGVVRSGGSAAITAALGHAYAAAGKEREAREVLGGLLERSKKQHVPAYEIASVYAGLGDKDRAFVWLQKAYQERSNTLVYFRMDPRIWSLQPDPRFQELLRRMNFPAKIL